MFLSKRFPRGVAMTITINSAFRDEVIMSAFSTGHTDYRFALDNFPPLMGRFKEQRNKQNTKFYSRLRSDIVAGCVMPPLTIAFVDKRIAKELDVGRIQDFINQNIKKGYILDGIQRMNTLIQASRDEKFDDRRPVFLNIIIAERYDLLLYRMITLNNGQKPMTPRHQIEILTNNLLDFEEMQHLNNIEIKTEKDASWGSFKLSDVSAAYTAYLTNNVNNQNNKIIEEKMSEIIVGRVMESSLREVDAEFKDIISLVDVLCSNKDTKKWLRIQNNLIGFTVGAKVAYEYISIMNVDDFNEQVVKFEGAFDSINPSKVNVGRYRRELLSKFIEKIERVRGQDTFEIVEWFSDLTAAD